MCVLCPQRHLGPASGATPYQLPGEAFDPRPRYGHGHLDVDLKCTEFRVLSFSTDRENFRPKGCVPILNLLSLPFRAV